MKTKVLLGLLADQRIHSGQSLAEVLGVSRTAVWKQVQRAVDRGFPIETLRGQGYRLTRAVDLLDHETIVSALPETDRSRVSLRVFDSVNSTNAEIAEARRAGDTGILVCVADMQSAGRGRRGRDWLSPRGENVYASFGLTLHGGFASLDGLSLVLGIAVAEALESLGADSVQLKWPNDVLVAGAKIGGILIELQGELEEGRVNLIAGIGLNVHMQDAPGIEQAWTSLARAFPAVTWQRNQIIAALISAVVSATERFDAQGFEVFRERWVQRDFLVGKALNALGGELSGVGVGVDGQGNYLIDSNSGRQAVRAGEISLRVES
ncbi:biotin--[acetyl-CoA-carboxylase] ligase [Marinobacter sp. X15-166B]|uniref:biotin--[acetyl-CoA-carboxylase] ligase n=1 Tax=Marinobacter sp. X15-166B TaxID=1897620 RepID=UPI00085BFEFA|nr:biotin--[acetyl-CoA-carboxylase] ligase [Marinobacter sp. X15-166B]OEY66532.1 biotin--[acetyl-CoA-carboxylase] ligase [Marinobacter sp. X15-166B]